jgi:hypothetical protein
MQKEFLTSVEERNAARLKQLQAKNEEYEKILSENEALRANLIKNRTKLSSFSNSSSSTPSVITEKNISDIVTVLVQMKFLEKAKIQ